MNPEAGPSRPRRPSEAAREAVAPSEIQYSTYESEEKHLQAIMELCDQELSEPYSIYTFRYFLQDWPHLSFLAYPPSTYPPTTPSSLLSLPPNTSASTDSTSGSSTSTPFPIACVICKQESHRGKRSRGYIAMLTVDKRWRRKGVAKRLVKLAIEAMIMRGAEEVVLETEYDNLPSLALYTSLGFFKEKRLSRFYMNGKDAFRLVLPIPQNVAFSIFPPETPLEAAQAREILSLGGVDDVGYPMDTSPPPPLPEGMDMAAMDGYASGGRQGEGMEAISDEVRINAGVAGIVI